MGTTTSTTTTVTTTIISANGIINERERSVNFFDIVSSLPMVANTMYYISSKYNYVKGVNGKVEALFSGVERSFKRTTITAYNFSKKIVPYEYFEKLVSTSLYKIEAAFLLVKNTGEKIPASLKTLSTKYTEKISCLTKTTLKKVENMIDYALPAESTKTEEKGVLKRGICMISKIRIWILTTAKRVAHLKGETVTDSKLLSIKDMVNIAEHWLSNSYKKLQIKPTEEGILMKALRLSTLLTIGTTLSAIGTVEATLPKVKELARVMIIKSKAAVYASLKLSIHIRNKVYANAQRKVIVIVEISKKLQREILERLPFLMNSKQIAARCLIHSEVTIKQSDLERTSAQEKIPEEEFKEVETSSNENAEEMGSGESTDPRYYEVLPQNFVSNNPPSQETGHELCSLSTEDLENTSDTFRTLENSSTTSNTLTPSSSDTTFSPCDASLLSQGSSPSLESEDLAKSLSDQQEKIIKPRNGALWNFFRR